MRRGLFLALAAMAAILIPTTAQADVSVQATCGQFSHNSLNGGSYGRLWYCYTKQSNGWYRVTATDIHTADGITAGDQWGGAIFAHYETRSGYYPSTLVGRAHDYQSVDGPPWSTSDVKNVWFEICNEPDHSDSYVYASHCRRMTKDF
ncbi:hypothetical protein [Phytomonospora endophytica]|uniref:Uncharacterized protein n=1 Tax=Phytomonospora endophytica TaxID=714109 RepID=A0A841FMN1_9ACTN|nr:hypothetical protein [Phytomonospora endophytica]MBB6035058.1 hypothetical protein [Phytomonospora endophytica]GIG68312.1 hypothetical protein Pen01_46070 [Phytomonospora endophytica]